MAARDTLNTIDETLTELDRLDPAPVTPPEEPPPPRRRAPRRKGDTELAVARDLGAMPETLRKGALAAVALKLARELDTWDMTPRDAAGHSRELRMTMTALSEQTTGERQGDSTSEFQERRARRLAAGE